MPSNWMPMRIYFNSMQVACLILNDEDSGRVLEDGRVAVVDGGARHRAG
jgi:hypothetical protein